MVVAGAFAVAACGSGGGGGGNLEAFCAAFGERSPLGVVGQLTVRFAGTLDDPEEVDEWLDKAQSDIEAVADAAPDEISGDIDVVVAKVVALLDHFREADLPRVTAETRAAIDEFFSDEEVGEAFDDAIAPYVAEECSPSVFGE